MLPFIPLNNMKPFCPCFIIPGKLCETCVGLFFLDELLVINWKEKKKFHVASIDIGCFKLLFEKYDKDSRNSHSDVVVSQAGTEMWWKCMFSW